VKELTWDSPDILEGIKTCFPNILKGLQIALPFYRQIKSFEDVETYLLRCAGLSPNTYRAYLIAVKQLYYFTNGLNPLFITPLHIKRYYDSIIRKVDRNTACLRIRGLHQFYLKLSKTIPGYISPFDVMDKKLMEKLNFLIKKKSIKKPLSKEEAIQLIAWLDEDRSTKGKCNHAMVLMIMTSGLRSGELCQLSWGGIKHDKSGIWIADFIGKGGRLEKQEMYLPALEVTKKYYLSQFERDPRPEDHLFYSLAAYPGDNVRPMTAHRLWIRISDIGEAARKAGVYKRPFILNPHFLRVSFAGRLYELGMKSKAIQEKTRHANIDSLLSNYFHDEDISSPYFSRMLYKGNLKGEERGGGLDS